ncbi:MAG: TolC family protein [Planctomycetales bacterium]|nr:TolC family protein [Planctomycetales bacterium]
MTMANHQTAEDLPAPPPADVGPLPAAEASSAELNSVGPLSLKTVLLSVEQSYPLLQEVLLEHEVAAGGRLAAGGEFDLRLKTANEAAPLGFYQTYRNTAKIEQATFNGGSVFGQYRIGRGDFEPWFGDRQTDDGGEFKLGFEAPLLSNRQIDRRRAAIFQADLDVQAVDPLVRSQSLEFARLATQAYWTWVGTALAVDAQQQLLKLAAERAEQIEERVRVGDVEPIVRIDNERLIASRETKLIESQRKSQQAAIKLSLFFRSADGKPIVPGGDHAPDAMIVPAELHLPATEDLSQQAAANRPEFVAIDVVRRRAEVALAEAENKLLPKLNAKVEASKDVGAPSSSKGDKTPFKLEAGLFGEVPLQRSEAHGKIHAVQAKLAQIDVKRGFLVDKVGAEVQDAVSAMTTAAQRTRRAEDYLRLAQQSLDLGRVAFDAGDSDVITLNIREQAVTDAQLSLLSSQVDFLSAQADFRAAMGLDPLVD